MGIQKNKQSGFSAVEALLILVIVGLLGFTGWYVWHAKQTADKTLSADNTSAPSFSKKKSTPTLPTPQPATKSVGLSVNAPAGWKTYKNSNYGVAFAYPSQWSIHSQIAGGDLALYISQVAPAQYQKNQSNLSQFDKYLEVFMDVTKSSVSGANNISAGKSEGSINFGGTNYRLDGQTYNSNVVAVDVLNCAAGLTKCGDFIPTASGGSIEITVSSVANEQAATVPLDLNGNQYSTSMQIIKSIKF